MLLMQNYSKSLSRQKLEDATKVLRGSRVLQVKKDGDYCYIAIMKLRKSEITVSVTLDIAGIFLVDWYCGHCENSSCIHTTVACLVVEKMLKKKIKRMDRGWIVETFDR